MLHLGGDKHNVFVCNRNLSLVCLLQNQWKCDTVFLKVARRIKRQLCPADEFPIRKGINMR